ncbi:MAG: signal peptidase II [Defluviitaleaceae bacterium]|nr:signal peptidase II [Defluviitaleaceae bacterium]
MHRALIAVSALILLADQVCKSLARTNLKPGESVAVIPGRFHLTHARNSGAANGLFANNRRALMVFSFAAVLSEIQTFFELRRHFSDCKAAWWLFAVNIGGGASNLLDRLLGQPTIDYLHICPNRKSPIFNIADIFILIGTVGLLILYIKRIILNK